MIGCLVAAAIILGIIPAAVNLSFSFRTPSTSRSLSLSSCSLAAVDGFLSLTVETRTLIRPRHDMIGGWKITAGISISSGGIISRALGTNNYLMPVINV